MTNDELADAFAANLAELHAKIDELPDGHTKRRANRLANVAHEALSGIQELGVDENMVQPFSGGLPKPPTP